MKTSLIVITLMLTIILGCISFFSFQAMAESGVELKAVSFLPKGNTGVDPAFWFINSVNERTKGKLTIKFVGGPETIPMFEQPEAIKRGAVDMIFNVTGFYVGQMPEGLSAQLSRISPMDERKSGYYDLMLELHRKKLNAYYLGRFVSSRGFLIGTNSKVKAPYDFKGKRLSTGRVCDPFIKKLGAVPQFIPLTDVYTALERGVADGVVFATGSFLNFHWHEITKFFVNHILFPAGNQTILINLDKWNRIPSPLQDILKEEAVKLEYKVVDFCKKETVDNIKKIREAGVESIEFSKPDAEWWDKTSYEAQWEEVREKVSSEIYQKLRETTKK